MVHRLRRVATQLVSLLGEYGQSAADAFPSLEGLGVRAERPPSVSRTMGGEPRIGEEVVMTKTSIACPSCGARNRVPVATGGKPRCGKCSTDLPWLVDVGADQFGPAIEKSSLPVLVDLWALWCGPCRMVAPALEKLALERAGTLRVVKVNVDESPEVSAQFGVQGIPTMLLFDDGVEIARQVGALPLDGIRSWVDSSLASMA